MQATFVTIYLLVNLLMRSYTYPAQPTPADPCLNLGQPSLIRECQDR